MYCNIASLIAFAEASCPLSDFKYFSSDGLLKNPNSIKAGILLFNSKTAKASSLLS